MHSRITLSLWHHEGHDPPLPPVDLHRGEDRVAVITFHETDDESARILGCPECLIALLRGTADRIEHDLSEGRWTDGPPEIDPWGP